jgi:DNA-binding MarR family transcriptional regulator
MEAQMSPVSARNPAPQNLAHVEVFNEIGAISYFVRQTVVKRLPPGMTYAHFELLNFLMRYGDGQTPAELARALLLTKGALTAILQKLEAKGYVAVLGDVSDKRKKRVRLTRDGLEAQSLVLRGMKDKTEALRDGFTDNEFRQALPFLKALRTFLVEAHEDAANAPAEPVAAHR